MGGWPSKKAAPASPSSGWSALPPELLDLVIRRLPSLADRFRFSYVCHPWLHFVKHYYSLSRLPSALPWLNFRDGSFRSLPDGELHSFRFRHYAFCYGCSDNWLLFEDPWCRRISRRYYLKSHLLRATKRLPGYCKEPVNYLNPTDALQGSRSSSIRRSINFHISKVILCSRDLVVAIASCQKRPDVVVCCRPDVSSSWSTGLCNGRWYQDMALHEGKLYTVTIEGDLFLHEVSNGGSDAEEPRVSRMDQVIRQTTSLNCCAARRCYLVTSCTGRLLMVRWIVPEESTREIRLEVFEADFEMSRWLEVESLGDQVLFVSSYCSKAVTASSHGDYLQGNRIYFLDDGIIHWLLGPRSNRPACGVFDMSSKAVHPISLGGRNLSFQTKASWLFP